MMLKIGKYPHVVVLIFHENPRSRGVFCYVNMLRVKKNPIKVINPIHCYSAEAGPNVW